MIQPKGVQHKEEQRDERERRETSIGDRSRRSIQRRDETEIAIKQY